jgi:hypothetical protein
MSSGVFFHCSAFLGFITLSFISHDFTDFQYYSKGFALLAGRRFVLFVWFGGLDFFLAGSDPTRVTGVGGYGRGLLFTVAG